MKGSSIYLTIYNALSYISWTYVFVGCLLHLKGRFMISNYYPPALLFIVQTLNVLDIIHVVAGLVQTSLFLTFIQVLSRIVVLWIPILFIMRRNVSSAGPFLCSLAWSLADLIRYLYYICTPSQLNIPLPFIRTLRYNMFVVLYPIGVFGEMLSIYRFISFYPKYKTRVIICCIFVYLPGLWMLFRHLFQNKQKRAVKEE